MSLKDTIEGVLQEAEGNTVSRPKKEAESVAADDDKKGFSRSSAAKARPAREAASSVRVSSGSSSKGGLGTPETKEEKRDRRRREREEENLRNRAYDLVLRSMPDYRRTDRVFWILVGVGMVFAVISLVAMYRFGEVTDVTSPVGMFSTGALLLAYVCIIGAIIFSRTQFGRDVIAVGGNPEAARVSGISVPRTRILVSALLGVTIAITALVSCGRVASAQTTLGGDTVMDIIAAVVIGGTPMGGGSGTVVGTLFGCLVIGLISNGLNLLRVSSFWQMVSKGVIILVAVILDVYSERIYERMRNKD